MTMLGKVPWNKGKSMPHTPEWEAKRIAAVRRVAAQHDFLRGYHRPESATKPMREAIKKWRAENPDRVREIALKNLPKGDFSGANNPNWRGGTSDMVKSRGAVKEYADWRDLVLQRDGCKCRECGSSQKLEAHHILPVAKYPDLIVLKMNGVTLCHECHKLTDSYAGRGARAEKSQLGDVQFLLARIPHKYQSYETVGNWEWTTKGIGVVFVSDIGSFSYECLVMIHEFVEMCLCRSRGITAEQVTKFDEQFESDRKAGTHSPEVEPGDDPRAPYRREHFTATNIERIIAAELGVDWAEYDSAINAL